MVSQVQSDIRRMMVFGLIVTALVAGLAASAAHAADEVVASPGDPDTVALTIHGDDTAVVRETRRATVPAGESRVAFPRVPETADATSVRLRAVDDTGGLVVLERVLSADVPSRRRLLEISVGKEIGVLVHDQGEGAPPRRVSATVLSVAEDVVLEMEGNIRVGLPGDLVLDALPEGLRASPTLLATVRAEAAGARVFALTYLAGGLSWTADYTLDLDSAMSGASLTGWATISNISGRAFEHARVTLAAGEVAVPIPSRDGGPRPAMAMMRAEADSVGGGMPPIPRGQAQAGQHFYPLDRPVTLAHRQSLQVALVDAPTVAVEARHVIPSGDQGRYTSQAMDSETVFARRDLVLTNTEDAGLGRALPAGTVRVWQPGPDGAPRFMGADRLETVPVGGEATLSLGTDADVTAERTRTAFRRIGDRMTETEHAVVLRNGKPDRDVAVVVEALIPGDWSILSESHPHEQKDARRLNWTVEVPAAGETRLTYAVRTRF